MSLELTNFEPLLDALQEPLFVLDGDRQISFMNKKAVSLFGQGFTGQNFVRVIRHPECIALIAEAWDGAKPDTVQIAIEYPIDGVFEFRATRLDHEEGGEPFLLVSLKDVTDLKKAEQMRSDFVANVSHELRSPLTALSGFIDTLNGAAKDDPKARERFLELMEKESARMIRLISDLLSLSKVEASQHQRPTSQLDMAEMVKRVVATLSPAAQAENKVLHLEIEGQPDPIRGNEDELTQLVINLIENAIKYGASDSEIRVCLKHTQDVPGIAGPALTFAVQDQGQGIGREHIPRLTERFYRVDTHRSRDKGGTGLGLAIVKHIVNQHRGRLNIASIEGEGSTFLVHLPVDKD